MSWEKKLVADALCRKEDKIFGSIKKEQEKKKAVLTQSTLK